MKTKSNDHGDLAEDQSALIEKRRALVEKVAKVEKVVEILNAGGQLADMLSDTIFDFHERLREELHQAGSPAESSSVH